MKKLFAITIILLILVGILVTVRFIKENQDIRQRASSNQAFVTAVGTKLYLNGQPFSFLGVNRFNIITVNNNRQGCDFQWTKPQLDQYFSELHAMNANAIRFFAFQSFFVHVYDGTKGQPHQWDGQYDFSRLDYLLTLAQKYNVYLVPILENEGGNGSCTELPWKGKCWFLGQCPADPNGEVRGYLQKYYDYSATPHEILGTYKDFIKAVIDNVDTYQNGQYSQNILMWQMMNESAICNSPDGCYEQVFYNWASDVSSYIKSVDISHNMTHLVSLGTIGDGSYGWDSGPGSRYRHIHSIPSIDLLEVHSYGHETEPSPPVVVHNLQDSQFLQKPLFIGETGMSSGSNRYCSNHPPPACFPPDTRAQHMSAKINYLFQNGGNEGVGLLIWEYRENQKFNPDYAHGAFDKLPDPLAQVLYNYNVNGPTSTPTLTPFPTGTGIPSPTDTPTPTPFSTGTPTPTPTGSITPTTTPTPSNTSLSLTVGLHGIGFAGDNVQHPGPVPSPTPPLHPTRNLTLTVYDLNNTLVTQLTGQISYNDPSQPGSSPGLFTGSISLPSSFPTGDYQLFLSSPSFLQRGIPGATHIIQNQSNSTPSVFLINGDVNNDNKIDLVDYSLIIDCFGAKQSQPSCHYPPIPPGNGSLGTPGTDILDDDGTTDGPDYNLFLRELSVQFGQ